MVADLLRKKIFYVKRFLRKQVLRKKVSRKKNLRKKALRIAAKAGLMILAFIMCRIVLEWAAGPELEGAT